MPSGNRLTVRPDKRHSAGYSKYPHPLVIIHYIFRKWHCLYGTLLLPSCKAPKAYGMEHKIIVACPVHFLFSMYSTMFIKLFRQLISASFISSFGMSLESVKILPVHMPMNTFKRTRPHYKIHCILTLSLYQTSSLSQKLINHRLPFLSSAQN